MFGLQLRTSDQKSLAAVGYFLTLTSILKRCWKQEKDTEFRQK